MNPFVALLELPLSKGQFLVLSFMPGNLNNSEEKLKFSSSFLALLQLPVSEIFPKKNSPLRPISTFQLGGMASGTRRLVASWRRASGYAAPHLSRTTPTRLPQDDHRLVIIT
jgi:hypothetical protein